MAGKKNSLLKKIILAFVIIVLAGGGIFGYKYYGMIYQSNVTLKGKATEVIYIHTGATFQDVSKTLYEKGFIVNRSSFEWLAERKGYNTKVKPGKYLIKNDMSNNELINLLRSGKQEAVKLVFNNIRTKYQLAGRLSKQIEADSTSLIDLMNDENFLKSFSLNPENVVALFIPNTYEINWNTSAKQLFERMKTEYDKFWNQDRKDLAKNANLTPVEVSVLASIVQEETNKTDEMARVAGVYINRLEKDMKLEADPTVKFSMGDFKIKRILKKHLQTDSPYNTYMYKGLPPGPICVPTSTTIDKVLNFEHHKFIYFCAKEDFSGYHNFARTGEQHRENARRYQNALNKRNIK